MAWQDDEDDEKQSGATATATEPVFDPDEFMKTRGAGAAPAEFDPDSFMASRNAPKPPAVRATSANLPGSTQKLRDTVNLGITPMAPKTEFEKQRTEGERGAGMAIERSLPGLFAPDYHRPKGMGILDSTANLVSQLENIPTPGAPARPAPEDHSLGLMGRLQHGWESATDPRAKIGNALAYAIGPYIGMDPEAAERRAEHADTSGILGQAAVPAASAIVPAGLSAAKAFGRNLTTPRMSSDMLSEEATRNLQEPAAGRGTEKLFRAATPPGGNVGFRESLSIAAPDLAEMERGAPLASAGGSETLKGRGVAGGILKPDMRVRQTVANIDARLDKIWNEQRQPQIDRWADSHTMTREQFAGRMEPDELRAVAKKLDVDIPENIDLRTADDLLKKVNAHLRKVEGGTPESKALAQATNPMIDDLTDLKGRLHDAIGRTLEDHGEQGIKEFNRRYGALSEVRDAFRNRMNPVETSRLLDDMRITGGLRGPGILERLHVKASPGRLVQKGLEDLAGTKLRAATDIPPTYTGPAALLPSPTPQVPYSPESLGDASGLLGQAALPTPLVWSPEMREAIARETPLRPPEAAVTQEGIGSVENPEAVGTRGEEGTRFGPKGLLPAPQPGVEPYLNERPEAVNPANRPLRVETPNRTEAVGVLPTLTGPIQDRMWGGMGTQGAQPGMLGFALPEQEVMGRWGPGTMPEAPAAVAEPPKEPLNFPRQDLPQGGLPLKPGEDIQGELAKTREQSRADRRRATLSSASQAIEEDINRPERAEGMMGAAEARPQYKYKPSEKAATLAEPRREYGPEFDQQEFQEEINRSRRILNDPKATDDDRAVATDRLRDAQEGLDRVRKGGPVVPEPAAAAAPARGTFAPEVEPPEVVADKAKELGLIWHDPGGAMRGMYESFSDPQTGHTLNIKVKDLSPEALQTKVEQARAAGSSVPETLKGKVGNAPAEAPAAAAPEYSAEDLRQKYGISEMQSLKDLANRKLIELQDNGRWRVTPEGERQFEAQKKSLSPVKSRSEGIFPGMEEDVERQAEGAARVKGEDLTREANTPQNIDRAAGEMETKSPLFRGTAASPQKEMFMAGESAEPEPRPKMEGIFGVIADMERARENRPANTPEEDQAAETLVKNTIEALQSGDRPGRYFAEVPQGEYNLKTSAEKGVTRSGHWYGVKSARGMMGWLARHPWTATQMERVLKAGPKSGMYRQMMDAAADWLRTRGESGRVREPGED